MVNGISIHWNSSRKVKNLVWENSLCFTGDTELTSTRFVAL